MKKVKKNVGTKEVVINKCFGGFGLSHDGVMYYAKLKGIKLFADEIRWNDSTVHKFTKKDKEPICLHYATKMVKTEKELNDNYFSASDIKRDDPLLVQTVKDLGKKSWGKLAELKVVEIPNDVNWELDEYDGIESVRETSRNWG
jgi:hypothetical protein